MRKTRLRRAHACKVQVFPALEFVSKLTRPFIAPGLRVAQVRAVFTLPMRLQAPLLSAHLAYIEWFTPFRSPDPDSKLHVVSCSTRTHARAAEIIPKTSSAAVTYLRNLARITTWQSGQQQMFLRSVSPFFSISIFIFQHFVNTALYAHYLHSQIYIYICC